MASDGDGLVLGQSNVSLAGAVSIARSNAVSTIGTVVPGDSLALDAPLVTADGRVEVSGTMDVSGGFDTLSCAAGILNLGTVSSNVSGISVGGVGGLSTAFLWHAASYGQSQSHWELVGGDLMVTRARPDVGRLVSYTLRIADDDSFEIHQSTSNLVGPGSHRRVARFGVTS